MTTFSKHDLYGGAITVELPQDYIDGSDIRQVPSHQELFLSRETLTSLIIELNARLPESDEAAVTSHFNDPIEVPDSCTMRSASKVILSSSTICRYPAYVTIGDITNYERHAPAATTVKAYLLLVRIEDKTTDLCVRLNVPLKELNAAESQQEETLAKAIMERIVATLEVKDFGLFVD